MQFTVLGRRFHRRVIIEDLGLKDGQRYCKWRCDCGTVGESKVHNVRYGKSCGCLRRETTSELMKTHGQTVGADIDSRSRTKAYRAWQEAKRRCFDPNRQNYPYYGGRGIKMCERWRHSFEAFFADMGKCPDGYSLDRKDVNGNYEPGNCQWATRATQNRNQRSNVVIEYGGQKFIFTDLARKYGIAEHRLRYFYMQRGLSIEEALAKCTTPVRRRR